MTAATEPVGRALEGTPRLHVPDEPVSRRLHWLSQVHGGEPPEQVLLGAGGVAEWLWERWRVLDRSGVGREELFSVVAGYRRELWLWLAGERTWQQCCSGLMGRLGRRVPA